MGNLKTKVIVLALTHLAEDNRKLVFAPIDKDDNIVQGVAPFSIIVKGEKNDKHNFAEGEIYSLTITSDEVKTPPAPPAKDANKAKGKDTPPAPPATKTTEEIEADKKAQDEIEANANKAGAGSGEGQ